MIDRLGSHSHGSREWWEEYFSPGAGWETNGGRIQTKVFAKAFLKRIKLDKETSFSLLDVGCALGDAIALFKKHFPNAALFGIDISETAILRCREEIGKAARFQAMRIEDISGCYDVIYCSALLEHFVDYKQKARHLATKCKILYVLVPFRELRQGKPLQRNPEAHHQHTFDFDSFEFLVSERLATAIDTRVFTCPGAWSWTWRAWFKEMLIKNPLRFVLRRPVARNPRMILFSIHSGSPYTLSSGKVNSPHS